MQMKYLAALLLATSLVSTAGAGSVQVDGYFKSNGTYVRPHYRSSPDSSVWNNWSTEGNVNPYTGAGGTKKPYASGNKLVSPYNGAKRTNDPFASSNAFGNFCTGVFCN
jgi:hypothetical protein